MKITVIFCSNSLNCCALYLTFYLQFIILRAVPIVFLRGTLSQIVFTTIISLGFTALIMELKPYQTKKDNRVAIVAMWALVLLLMSTMLIRVSQYETEQVDLNALGVALILLNLVVLMFTVYSTFYDAVDDDHEKSKEDDSNSDEDSDDYSESSGSKYRGGSDDDDNDDDDVDDDYDEEKDGLSRKHPKRTSTVSRTSVSRRQSVSRRLSRRSVQGDISVGVTRRGSRHSVNMFSRRVSQSGRRSTIQDQITNNLSHATSNPMQQQRCEMEMQSRVHIIVDTTHTDTVTTRNPHQNVSEVLEISMDGEDSDDEVGYIEHVEDMEKGEETKSVQHVEKEGRQDNEFLHDSDDEV